MCEDSFTKADFERVARFRYALRKFIRFSEHAARSNTLTPQQYQALLAIQGFPGRDHVTVGELAEQLQLTHHSAVGLVDRMEALGHVQRAPCTEDRRRVWVSLTPTGRALLGRIFALHREELQSAGPILANLVRQAARQMPDEAD